MYKRIAEKLYDLLVVNSYAAAIQQPDGRYITKYFPLNAFVIEEMLKNHGSMGCYQQGYKTGRIKWICFDFDSDIKNNPDIESMFSEMVSPFLDILDSLSISYLTEFSGRRGIHVWIVFDSIFSKKLGYQIVQSLKKSAINILDNPKIHIDYFPATDSIKGNVVGKQVKFPLSYHKTGGRSYLFKGEFVRLEEVDSESFLHNQLDILESYIPNDVECIKEKLCIQDEEQYIVNSKYKKYNLTRNIEVTLSEIEEILSETKVYREIFSRMKKGKAKREDWCVLLGTLSACDDSYGLIYELFASFPNYDFEKTSQNIKKLGNKYFPATFRYLYQLYMLEPEKDLDLNETGLIYLLKKLKCDDVALEVANQINEHVNTKNLAYTLQKEKNYLLDNDEVPNMIIWNRLNSLKPIDLRHLDEKINSIRNGAWSDYLIPTDFCIYERIESDEKTRKMVSLSAEDRILTTHLVLLLQSSLNTNWHSYSYNISPCSKEQIFYAWYSSWMNYITNIQAFLEIPFLNKYNVFVMDLKNYYDKIDFLSVYLALEKMLKPEDKNIMMFLINYNENVMKIVNPENKKGVPQGPAYARYIAEVFLDYIIQSVLKKYDEKAFHYYRYVDDIIVYFEPSFDGNKLFDDLENTLLSYGLPLNKEKSNFYGCIKDLSDKEKSLIAHKDKFSYDLYFDETTVIFEDEQNRRILKFLEKHDYDLSVLSYVFGSRSLPKSADYYYRRYSDKIFSEIYGRGSYFKKFYHFLFEDNNLLEEALNSESLQTIPVDSLNMSNFIHCLYLSVKNKTISKHNFYRIKGEVLEGLFEKISNKSDRDIIGALLLLRMEE